MRLNDFMAGADLLANHFNDRSGFHIGAEHDQFYVYATDRPLSPEDVKRMHELGWFQEDAEAPAYDPAGGWTCYV